MVACTMSVGGMVLWSGTAWIIKRLTGFEGWSISHCLSKWPGYQLITGKRGGGEGVTRGEGGE